MEEEEYELRSTYGSSFTVIDAASARKGENNRPQHQEQEQDKEKEKGKEKEGGEIKKASRRQLGRSRSLSPKRRQLTPESTPEKSSQDTKSGKAKRRKRRSKKRKSAPSPVATFASLCAEKFPHLKTWAITLEPSEGLGSPFPSLIFHI